MTIIGQSRGGLFAKALAARRPDLVSGIVTLGAPTLSQLRIHPLVLAQVAVVGALGTGRVPGMFSIRCLRGGCCERFHAGDPRPVPGRRALHVDLLAQRRDRRLAHLPGPGRRRARRDPRLALRDGGQRRRLRARRASARHVIRRVTPMRSRSRSPAAAARSEREPQAETPTATSTPPEPPVRARPLDRACLRLWNAEVLPRENSQVTAPDFVAELARERRTRVQVVFQRPDCFVVAPIGGRRIAYFAAAGGRAPYSTPERRTLGDNEFVPYNAVARRDGSVELSD